MTEIRTLKRIDAASAPKLDAQLKELQASGEDEIIVDMEETTYISSVGLRASRKWNSGFGFSFASSARSKSDFLEACSR